MERQAEKAWFTGGGSTKILKAGIYKATLTAVSPGVGKGYGQKDERPILMFSFQELTQGAAINRTVTRSNSDKSQLVALIRAMTGAAAPKSETVIDPEAFKEFILSLVGRVFLVQVEPSRDGKFNNLVAAFPVPGDSQ